MQQYIWYLLIATAVPGLVFLFCPQGAVKKISGTATLIFASLVVFLFLGGIMSGSGRMLKTSAGVPAEKAELQLRLSYAVVVGMQDLASRMALKPAERTKVLKEVTDLSQAYEGAEAGLAEAIARGDETAVIKAKVAVLLYVKEINKRLNPRKAHPVLQKASKPKAELPAQLTDPVVIARELEKDSDPKMREVAKTMQLAFTSSRIPAAEVPRLMETIENGMPFGWYRDALLRILSSKSPGNSQLEQLIRERNNIYLRTFVGAIIIMVVAVASTAIGALVILIEAALTARRSKPKEDEVGLDIDLFTVYKVFIAWFCTQALISLCLQQAVKSGFKLPADPFNMAIVTAVTYVIANVPGLLFIYLLALKPKGLKFWEALKFRTRTKTASTFKLIVAGYLGWCAAFPMVIVTALIASIFMNSQGSENPVISQIMSAANAPDPIVILLFYLTIAVLAPICEETMFRGFIYGSLRKRLGVAVSLLCSAMIFGLVHFDKGGILGLTAIGFVLAYSFERTRSLLPCMITHGLWNGGMFTATLILFGTR